jgi:hypothetical protein
MLPSSLSSMPNFLILSFLTIFSEDGFGEVFCTINLGPNSIKLIYFKLKYLENLVLSSCLIYKVEVNESFPAVMCDTSRN